MDKIMYNYQFNKKYSLNKTNIYAYSFFATSILKKKEDFNIDLDSIISHISDSISDNDQKLKEIRSDNHQKYYNLDIKFLEEIYNRYKDSAKKALIDYRHIKSRELLTENEELALYHQKQIKRISDVIENLKNQVKDDLMTIMDYVDQDEKQLDLTFLQDENVAANKLKRKYNALILKKSVINMDNLNLEMERQKQRLVSIRQLLPLAKRYASKRTYYLSDKYKIDDLKQLKENLSIILNEYIYLLSHQEFNEVRKLYQGILDDDFSYVDDFMYTYKIILDKIWKNELTQGDNYVFGFNYLVCDINSSRSDLSMGLMNRKNMSYYNDIGYICSCNGNLFDIIDISKEQLLLIKFPHQIEEECVFKVNQSDSIVYEGIYNKSDDKVIHQDYSVIDIK